MASCQSRRRGTARLVRPLSFYMKTLLKTARVSMPYATGNMGRGQVDSLRKTLKSRLSVNLA